jgi:hypothetical protein
MPPRSLSGLSDRSPVCVSRWDDVSSCGSSVEYNKPLKKGSAPLARSVVFAEHNEVFEIPHLDDIPQELIPEIWYDASEYAQIKKNYQLTIFLMESGEELAGDHHTSRGLEYRTQEGAWARYENKRDAYNAVLDEQDRQWKEDIDDWEKISRLYLQHSSKCLKSAFERGANDEKEIKEYMAETSAKKVSSDKKLKKKKSLPISSKSEKDKEKSKSSSKDKDKDSNKTKRKKSERRSEKRETI